MVDVRTISAVRYFLSVSIRFFLSFLPISSFVEYFVFSPPFVPVSQYPFDSDPSSCESAQMATQLRLASLLVLLQTSLSATDAEDECEETRILLALVGSAVLLMVLIAMAIGFVIVFRSRKGPKDIEASRPETPSDTAETEETEEENPEETENPVTEGNPEEPGPDEPAVVEVE